MFSSHSMWVCYDLPAKILEKQLHEAYILKILIENIPQRDPVCLTAPTMACNKALKNRSHQLPSVRDSLQSDYLYFYKREVFHVLQAGFTVLWMSSSLKLWVIIIKNKRKQTNKNPNNQLSLTLKSNPDMLWANVSFIWFSFGFCITASVILRRICNICSLVPKQNCTFCWRVLLSVSFHAPTPLLILP